MLGKVLPGVRESLDWLNFNEEERHYLSFMRENSNHFAYYGGNESAERAFKGFAADYIQVVGLPEESVNDFMIFVKNKLGNFEEIDKFLIGEALLGGYPRHAVFLRMIDKLLSGALVGAPLVNIWEEQLELAQGNILEALVALEFLKP